MTGSVDVFGEACINRISDWFCEIVTEVSTSDLELIRGIQDNTWLSMFDLNFFQFIQKDVEGGLMAVGESMI